MRPLSVTQDDPSACRVGQAPPIEAKEVAPKTTPTYERKPDPQNPSNPRRKRKPLHHNRNTPRAAPSPTDPQALKGRPKLALKGRPNPAQGIALGPQRTKSKALKGRPKNPTHNPSHPSERPPPRTAPHASPTKHALKAQDTLAWGNVPGKAPKSTSPEGARQNHCSASVNPSQTTNHDNSPPPASYRRGRRRRTACRRACTRTRRGWPCCRQTPRASSRGDRASGSAHRWATRALRYILVHLCIGEQLK